MKWNAWKRMRVNRWNWQLVLSNYDTNGCNRSKMVRLLRFMGNWRPLGKYIFFMMKYGKKQKIRQMTFILDIWSKYFDCCFGHDWTSGPLKLAGRQATVHNWLIDPAKDIGMALSNKWFSLIRLFILSTCILSLAICFVSRISDSELFQFQLLRQGFTFVTFLFHPVKHYSPLYHWPNNPTWSMIGPSSSSSILAVEVCGTEVITFLWRLHLGVFCCCQLKMVGIAL
jgi:hypothetical protein